MRVAGRAAVLAAASSLISSAVPAQRTSRERRTATAEPAPTAVRAELAGVLLQSGRYEEATREYRVLLARDPANFEYRLHLAQALAWGDHPREAERELSQLAVKRPVTPTVDSLLRVVRDAYDPSAVEAEGWVSSEPAYAPYRVALARALAREKMPRLAIAQFDTLLSRPGTGSIPDRRTLLREMADAYVAARDRMGGAERLLAALALAPNDTAMRHTIAEMLAAGHRYAQAEAQYDTLLLQKPSGTLLLERAQIRLALGDRRGAETDLWASIGAQPSTTAYLLLGDLYRERGDYRGARSMYLAASQGAPREMRVPLAAALAFLDREERPAVLAPAIGDDPGWRLSEQAAADNAGVAYSVLSLRRTVPVAASTRVSLGAEWHQLAERTPVRHLDAVGYGATVGGWREAAYGPLLARVALDGGAIYHPLAGTLGEIHGKLSTWLFAWQGTVELGAEPAYPSLFSAEALLPGAGGVPLAERTAAISLGGPLGAFDVGARWERSALSDGNRRITIETSVRYPLGRNVSAVYSGSGVGFAERSTLYWDPERFAAHGVGLEYTVRHVRGLSVAARIVPTYATSSEASVPAFVVPGDPSVIRGPIRPHSAFQFGAGAEAGYRAPHWELAGALSYGRGRAGDYQRGAASVLLRLVP